MTPTTDDISPFNATATTILRALSLFHSASGLPRCPPRAVLVLIVAAPMYLQIISARGAGIDGSRANVFANNWRGETYSFVVIFVSLWNERERT